MAKWLKEGRDARGFAMEEEKEKRIGKERRTRKHSVKQFTLTF